MHARIRHESESSDSGRAVTVAIVGEDKMVREGMALLIDLVPGLRVVANESTCDAAIAALGGGAPTPDVSFIETESAGRNVESSVVMLRSAWPASRVILLLTGLRLEVIARAQSIGADGVVSMRDPFEDMRGAISTVLQGRRAYSPGVSSRLRARPGEAGAPSPSAAPRSPRITQRELEILQHLAEGKTVKQTALALGLAAPTVDNHKTRLMHKVEVHSGVQLVRYAIREGLIDP